MVGLSSPPWPPSLMSFSISGSCNLSPSPSRSTLKQSDLDISHTQSFYYVRLLEGRKQTTKLILYKRFRFEQSLSLMFWCCWFLYRNVLILSLIFSLSWAIYCTYLTLGSRLDHEVWKNGIYEYFGLGVVEASLDHRCYVGSLLPPHPLLSSLPLRPIQEQQEICLCCGVNNYG